MTEDLLLADWCQPIFELLKEQIGVVLSARRHSQWAIWSVRTPTVNEGHVRVVCEGLRRQNPRTIEALAGRGGAGRRLE